MDSTICPRCGIDRMDPVKVRNALSRTDNETYVCNRCGTNEAMRDFHGLAPIPPGDWPTR